MKTSERRASRVARRLAHRGLQLGLLAIGLVFLQASECTKEDFYNPFGGGSLLTGGIFGRITVGGTGRSDVPVTIRLGTTVAGTDMTDGNGDYRVVNLDPGVYTVSIPAITGADCPGDQSATVVGDDDTEVNFACTTQQPQTGTVTGTVTVNGTPEPGVAVTLREGTTVIGTTTTNTTGTYTFTNVATGTKNVSITNPEGATCPDPQDVTVPAGGTATADFPCTRPQPGFTISFSMPVPGYCHIALGDTRTYSGFWTNPAQPGAAYSFSWSGPGTVGGTTRTGSLDAGGGGFDEQMINQFGMYTGMAFVTVGGHTETASTTVNVTGAQGACQQISSLRYKRDVYALLPDDVRPLGLRPVAFRYVEPWGDPAEPRIGLIAEEVAEVFPGAVLRDAEGRPHMIDYRALTALTAEEAAESVGRAVEAAIERWAERF